MRDSDEKIFFFEGSKNRKLLGFLHLPPSEGGNAGIIFCHPFADEMNLSYRVVVETARIFAKQGFPVLRFHMSSCGDSEGELNEVTIDDWKADIECAVECLKTMLKIKKYALWGLRLGAGLALLHEMKFNAASFMVLWQPVISFSKYIQQFLRRKAILQLVQKSTDLASLSEIKSLLKKNKVVNAMGYPITDNLYQSFIAADQSILKFIPQCHTLLLSISVMERPNPSIIKYYNLLQRSNSQIKFKHINTLTFWDRYWQWESKTVTNATVEWLQNPRINKK